MKVGNGLWVLSLSVGGDSKSKGEGGVKEEMELQKEGGGGKGGGFQGGGDKFELLSLKE